MVEKWPVCGEAPLRERQAGGMLLLGSWDRATSSAWNGENGSRQIHRSYNSYRRRLWCLWYLRRTPTIHTGHTEVYSKSTLILYIETSFLHPSLMLFNLISDGISVQSTNFLATCNCVFSDCTTLSTTQPMMYWKSKVSTSSPICENR